MDGTQRRRLAGALLVTYAVGAGVAVALDGWLRFDGSRTVVLSPSYLLTILLVGAVYAVTRLVETPDYQPLVPGRHDPEGTTNQLLRAALVAGGVAVVLTGAVGLLAGAAGIALTTATLVVLLVHGVACAWAYLAYELGPPREPTLQDRFDASGRRP